MKKNYILLIVLFLAGFQLMAFADIHTLNVLQCNSITDDPGYENYNWSGHSEEYLGLFPRDPIAAHYPLLYHIPLTSLDFAARTSATFHINVQQVSTIGDSQPLELRIYPLTSEYVHGQVTWNNSKTSTPWTNPGGDYNNSVYATMILRADPNGDPCLPAPTGAHSCDIEPLMTYWETNPNYGMIMVPQNISGGTRYVFTENAADANARPYVELEQGTRILKATLYPDKFVSITRQAGYGDYVGWNSFGYDEQLIGWGGGVGGAPLYGYALYDQVCSVVIEANDFKVGDAAALYITETYLTISGLSQPLDVKIYPLTTPYVCGETSWLTRATGVNWTAAGGDYNTSVVANLQLRAYGNNPDGQYECDITDLMEYWETNPNYGMILVSQYYGGGGRYLAWDSHETDAPYIKVLGAAIPTSCTEVWALGYGIPSDVNRDCEVNMLDFAEMAESWLICNVPGQAGCVESW